MSWIGSKKNLVLSPRDKKELVDPEEGRISISRQTELLGLCRSGFYYRSVIDPYEEVLMRLIDEQYTKTPFYGSRRMTEVLKREGHPVNRKRIRRLMGSMGIEAIYPKPNLSRRQPENRIYPYLLRGLEIERNNQVWGSDITYIRLNKGWIYLVAIMDWYSRYVISWEISDQLEASFCLEALERALEIDKPEIFNTDQGSQFTSLEFTNRLERNDIRISMDGKGRAIDNIFTERLWRSLKYEEVYIRDYQSLKEAKGGIEKYLTFYNKQRLHQSLDYRTPAEVYWGF